MFELIESLNILLYRVSQRECARLRENVPYVKVHRSNPKHLYPKSNGYGDNGQRKVWSSCGSTYCTCSSDALPVHCACPSLRVECSKHSRLIRKCADSNVKSVLRYCWIMHVPRKVPGTLRTTTALVRVFMDINLVVLYHSYVNYMLSTDINITETTYSCQF